MRRRRNSDDDLIAEIHQDVTNEILLGLGVRDDEWTINCGSCEDWALLMIERLGEAGIEARELWLEEQPGYDIDVSHCVVVVEGRYYDSQHPYGVDDLSELDVVCKIPRGEAMERVKSRRQGKRNPDLDQHAAELELYAIQAQSLLEGAMQLNAAGQFHLAYNYAVESEHMAVLALHQTSYFRLDPASLTDDMAKHLGQIAQGMIDLAQRAQVERIVAARMLPQSPPGGAMLNPAMSTSEALAELGLASGASESEVKAAYRKLAVERHPDRGGDLEAMKRLNEARDVLEAYGTTSEGAGRGSESHARSSSQGSNRYAEYKRRNAPAPTAEYVADDLMAFAAEVIRLGRIQTKYREKVPLVPFDAFFDRKSGHYSRPFGSVVRTRKLKPEQQTPSYVVEQAEAYLEAVFLKMGIPGLARIFDLAHDTSDSWVIFQTLPVGDDAGYEYITVSFEEPKQRAPRKQPHERTTRWTVERKLRSLGFEEVAGGTKYGYWAPVGTSGKEGYFVRLAAKSARVVLRERRGGGFYDMGIDADPTYYGKADQQTIESMARLVERRRAAEDNPEPHRFKFLTDCLNIEGIFGYPQGGEIINYIKQHPAEAQVSYGQFARQVDLRPLRQARHPAMYRISAPDNWSISFHRSYFPSGQPIYYFAWSGIEHIFVDRKPDVAAELAALAAWEDEDGAAEGGNVNGNPSRGTRDKFARIFKESGPFGAYWALQAFLYYEGRDDEARWMRDVVPEKSSWLSSQFWESMSTDLIRGRLYANTTPTSSSPADKYLPWVGTQARRIAITLRRLYPEVINPFAAMITFADADLVRGLELDSTNLAGRYDAIGEITENFYPFVSMVRSRGIDIGQQDLFTAKWNLEEYKQEQAEYGLGGREVIPGTRVYEWDDGWSVHRLDTEAQLKSEGKSMDHCVGGYGGRELGTTYEIYSLRKGSLPAATIEWKLGLGGGPGPRRGYMEQVKGPGNTDVSLEVLARVAQFRDAYFPEGDRFDRFAWWKRQTAGSQLGHDDNEWLSRDDLVRQLVQANKDVLATGGPGVTARDVLR